MFHLKNVRYEGVEVRIKGIFLLFYRAQLVGVNLENSKRVFFCEPRVDSLTVRRNLHQWRSALEFDHSPLTEEDFEKLVHEMFRDQFTNKEPDNVRSDRRAAV